MDVATNKAVWGAEYDWSASGEEWSSRWGGSRAHWFGSVFPRIDRHLPTGTILEIAPGFGRWTHYLRDYCDRLVVVDISEKCIEACKRRFAGDERIVYHTNDGTSLDMIDDDSIDFVFSFDSLVHAEADVIAAYLKQIAAKLTRGGSGVIHHSNAGEYRRYYSMQRRLPPRLRGRLVHSRILAHDEWRASSMTAERFRALCEDAGLHCVTQELVNWGGRRLIDCMSVFSHSSSADPPTRVVRNPRFMLEADLVGRRTMLYREGTAGAAARRAWEARQPFLSATRQRARIRHPWRRS